MFGWFKKEVRKEEFDTHKGAVQAALNNIKHDMAHVTNWIQHLNQQDSTIKKDVEDIMKELIYIRQELEDIRQTAAAPEEPKIGQVFKQRQTPQPKQTAVYDVQTAAQTAVQAAFFNKLSLSEKALIGVLASSDLKLSYEDLAAMTLKDSTTIRGQINAIRQKVSGIIEEQIEKNNKKRLYIPEKVKGLLLKKAKIRAKKAKEEENE